jgi:hypothetical protein
VLGAEGQRRREAEEQGERGSRGAGEGGLGVRPLSAPPLLCPSAPLPFRPSALLVVRLLLISERGDRVLIRCTKRRIERAECAC